MKKILLSVIALIVTFAMGITSVFAADDSILVSPNSKITYSSEKSTIEFGDEICFDTECFYVMSSSDETTTLLAKYNLAVNNIITTVVYSSSEGQTHETIKTSTDDAIEVNNLQNSKFKGGVDGYGHVEYEDIATNGYLTTYKTKLEELSGVEIDDVRIPDANDSHDIGCDVGDSCNEESNTPEWAHSTNYYINHANTIKNIGINLLNETYLGSAKFPGVRPLIEVKTNLIKRNKVTLNPEDGTLSEEDGKTKITPATKEGYEVDKVTAKTSDGTDVTVTEKDGVYYINNSEITDDVTVTNTYKEKKKESNQTSTINKETKKVDEENPDTSDNASMIFMLCLCSIVGMVFASKYLREAYKA